MAEIDIEALAKKYGAAPALETKKAVPNIDIDALADKYGAPEIKKGEVQVNLIPSPIEPSAVSSPSSSRYRKLSKLPIDIVEGLSELPGDIGRSTAKSFESSRDLASSGLSDISKNMPASGIAKTALGGLGMLFSPVAGVGKEVIANPLTRLTGNRDFGERAEFIATGAIPINKFGKVISNNKPTNAALRELVDKIGPDNLKTAIDRLKANPRLSVMDVSEPVKMMGQKLILTEGNHQAKFFNAVNERTGGAKDAVKAAYDQTMGAPVNVLNKIEKMKADARATGATHIEPIIDKVGPVDITDAVKFIEKEIASNPIGKQTLKQLKAGEAVTTPLPSDYQNRLFELRQQLRGEWADKPQMFLDAKGEQSVHEIQKSLRAEAQKLLDSHDTAKHRDGARLMAVREKLVDAIDIPTGGKYREGLGKYKDDIDIQNAFTEGMNILRKSDKVEKRPEFLEAWIKKAEPAEIEAMREGARVAFDNQIKRFNPEADLNAKKLEILFGKKEANQMFSKLIDERDIALTNSDLARGSQTAMRLRADKSVDLPVEKPVGLGPFLAPLAELATASMTGMPGASVGVIGAQLAGKGIHKTKTSLAKAKNNVLTDLMTAQGDDRANLIKALENYIPTPQLSLANKVKLSLPVRP